MNKWHSDIMDRYTRIYSYSKITGPILHTLICMVPLFNGSKVDKRKSNDLACLGYRHPTTVFLHCCDILSWALVSSNQCRSTGLYGAINAGREPRSSSSTRKTGATWAELWIEWLPQRVPKNGERLYLRKLHLPGSSQCAKSGPSMGICGRRVRA